MRDQEGAVFLILLNRFHMNFLNLILNQAQVEETNSKTTASSNLSSMLACLALPAAAPVAAVVSANAEYTRRMEAPETPKPGTTEVIKRQPHELFDLGSSLPLGICQRGF